MTFHDLAVRFEKVEQTTSRNSITGQLAELFHLASADEIGKICYLLQGRVVPLYEAREFGVADKFMIRAIASAYGEDVSHVTGVFKREGDLGKAASVCHTGPKSGTLTVSEVYKKLYAVTDAGGVGSQDKKIALLADILSSVDALSACYIVRIPLDKLRLGFSDMTVLDALSFMLSGSKEHRPVLEDAYNKRPDIGHIAQKIKTSGITGLHDIRITVGAPILAALCQRLPTADEMVKKMGTVAVEPKYDGVRVQIHWKRKGAGGEEEVKTFSRNLENTTAMFPELVSLRDAIAADAVILDTEAVGIDPKTGAIVSFQETTTRKRKHNITEAQKNVPLRFFVFDILFHDGRDLLGEPLSARRKELTKMVHEGNVLRLSPQIVTDNPAKVRAYHDEQIKKNLEGVVVKKWDSPYEPGRKGYSWVKFKEEEGKSGKLTDTIDGVVMGYYKGEGKRADFGIGAFLVGVAGQNGFVTVTKVGTGVTDALWRQLKTRLQKLRSAKTPKEYRNIDTSLVPDVWIEPRVVVEIAGDDLTKSSVHGAGIAVRFPRLVRIREDKSPRQATTVTEIKTMYTNQSSKAQ